MQLLTVAEQLEVRGHTEVCWSHISLTGFGVCRVSDVSLRVDSVLTKNIHDSKYTTVGPFRILSRMGEDKPVSLCRAGINSILL